MSQNSRTLLEFASTRIWGPRAAKLSNSFRNSYFLVLQNASGIVLIKAIIIVVITKYMVTFSANKGCCKRLSTGPEFSLISFQSACHRKGTKLRKLADGSLRLIRIFRA